MGIDPTGWKRVAVRAPNWVGDAVMALPFFTMLRRLAPQIEIICLCKPNLSAMFADVPTIDRVLELEKADGESGWAFAHRHAGRLKQERADAAFCLPTSFGAALMIWLARVPLRYGHAAEGRRFLLTRSIPSGPNGKRPHRAEGYLSLLRLAFPDVDLKQKLTYRPGESAIARADAIMGDLNPAVRTPLLAIAPSAAQPNKMWSPDRFASIARRWIETTTGGVICVGGQADAETCAQVSQQTGGERVVNLAARGDLPVVAELIRRATVFLGNDSGLAHLAAAVGTPTVVISGPGDPAEVAPYSPLAHTIKHPLFCSPCYKNYCWRKDKPLECLTEVSIEDVWPHIAELAAKP